MKPGSTIAVIHEGFLPDVIRNVNQKLGERLGLNYTYPYNHFEKVVLIDGELYSCGAHGKGMELTPLDEYLKAHPNHLILEPVVDLNHLDIHIIRCYAEEVCKRKKRKYQRGLLLAYAIWVKWKIKWFAQGDKRLICYEGVPRFDNLINRRNYVDLDLPTVYEIIENPHFIAKGEVKKIYF